MELSQEQVFAVVGRQALEIAQLRGMLQSHVCPKSEPPAQQDYQAAPDCTCGCKDPLDQEEDDGA